MANVSTIKKVINETQDSIYIVVGQENNKSYKIESKSEYGVSIEVPWIGRENENKKAIRITIPSAPTFIWFFQDYHFPPNEDQIKYHQGETFSYKLAKNVDGESSGGGDKVLYFYEKKITENGVTKFINWFELI
ncbi:hypothetical protein [Photorhabdus sp. RW14-46]|uniref:hypothetical protein n=1 Tax=Photorhabdus sp. RW14-46 TaxID=2100168 RepID=UPI0013F48D15|nr:hypothetical protein [Photorhabdus sp. RW14-46]NHB60026.1 hypothetical protein [Photorhabdus sp. RW14-46]